MRWFIAVALAQANRAAPGRCTFAADTDYQCDGGSTVKAASQGSCCAACASEAQCDVGVQFEGLCYLKYGCGASSSRPKKGPVACMPVMPPTPPPPPPPTPSTPPPPLSAFIATQHFQPCYNLSTLPSLIDGAVQAARLGSTSFKFALKDNMAAMYPHNNDAAPWPQNVTSLMDVLGSAQVQQVLTNAHGTGFRDVTLWAYAIGGPDAPFCDHARLPIPPTGRPAGRHYHNIHK